MIQHYVPIVLHWSSLISIVAQLVGESMNGLKCLHYIMKCFTMLFGWGHGAWPTQKFMVNVKRYGRNLCKLNTGLSRVAMHC